MNVIIIEDELPAIQKLSDYLHKYDATIDIIHTCESIESAVKILGQLTVEVHLIFMDIQLSDGLSFEIMEQIDIQYPIIFTTAYDEYAIDAFKLNSIDYLLKPISYTALSSSLKKYKRLSMPQVNSIKSVIQEFKKKKYKDRFLVKLGNKINTISINDVAVIYAEGRTVYLITTQAQKFIIDYKIEQLTDILNPAIFNRINRSAIIQIKAIKEIIMYSNSRLKIEPTVSIQKELIVSREKVNEFKSWLEGGL